MSARRSAVSAASSSRGGVVALLVIVVAVAMLLLVRARPQAEPFDPHSSASQGARGLVLLLEKQGAAVDVVRVAPEPGAAVRVLVLQDRLDDVQSAALLDFAAAGGVVIMADPTSTFGGALSNSGSITGARQPSFPDNDVDLQVNLPVAECNVPSLDRLRGLYVAAAELFEVPPDARSCFASRDGAFVVAREHGTGLIVQLGDNALFTNGLIRYADNGPLATALLVPTADTSVAVLVGSDAAKSVADIGTGDETLADLLRPSMWMAFAQLAIAFVVFAVARAVRPGRPVREPEQAAIAGSELVVATGTLMQRAQHAERAGWMLRGNLYRALCRQFHLPSTTSIAALDERVANATNVPAGHVASVLNHDVHNEAELIQLCESLQGIRESTLEGATS